jgi:hypothetical protein
MRGSLSLGCFDYNRPLRWSVYNCIECSLFQNSHPQEVSATNHLSFIPTGKPGTSSQLERKNRVMTIRGKDWIRNHMSENVRYFSLFIHFRELIRPGLPGLNFESRAATRPVLYVFFPELRQYLQLASTKLH